jgi:hypothetical protein
MNTVRIAALAVACLVSLPTLLRANDIPEPSVPGDLVVGAGHRVSLVGHAVGTQNYVCLPKADSPTGFAWILYGPDATLFSDDGRQIATHFLSPNPGEEGSPPRPAWQHSRDTSAVWGFATVVSTDQNFVEPGAIPWLKLEVRGRVRGLDGGRRLTDTSFIQRVHTSGGAAPATGCSAAVNVGAKILVPYAADYYFYKTRGRQK